LFGGRRVYIGNGECSLGFFSFLFFYNDLDSTIGVFGLPMVAGWDYGDLMAMRFFLLQFWLDHGDASNTEFFALIPNLMQDKIKMMQQ
jgi:hypothetical protein